MRSNRGLEAHNPPPPPSFAGQSSLVRHRSDLLRRRTNRRRSSTPTPGLAAPLEHRRVPPPPNSAITVGTAPADELAGAHTPPATNLDEEAGGEGSTYASRVATGIVFLPFSPLKQSCRCQSTFLVHILVQTSDFNSIQTWFTGSLCT
uniref:Uncharacterized protein n=1 Tax=Aegilops tauschii subsp. strangulata TaxID=200361 RepID=A0A453HWT6_AEGTS